MRILVCNDDGFQAEGLKALAKAMESLGEVWVVAPDREQSASSHALSLHRPLRVEQVGERWFSVDGTPSDCVYLAVNHLMKEARPELLVSGINHGSNLADDVTYSGTVAAAMEASLLKLPAIAFSLVTRLIPPSHQVSFDAAARFAHALVNASIKNGLPENLLLNVNIPGHLVPRGYQVTKLGKHSYGYDVVENVDPRGRKYYWIGGTSFRHQDVPDSDCNAVFERGLISVTPLHLDLTHSPTIETLRGWSLENFAADPKSV